MRQWIDLVEKYETGFSGIRGAEVAIYRNPSPKEWKSCEQYGEVRAFIMGDDLLIWDVFAAVHQMVREHLHLPNTAIPVILAGTFRGEAHANITDNSRLGPWWHNGEVVNAIQECAYLKKNFSGVEVSFYDEAIEGPWDELSEGHLQERIIPSTVYGYWITSQGDVVAVPHESHFEVAKKLGTTYGHAMNDGWIRVIVQRRIIGRTLLINYGLGDIAARAISALKDVAKSQEFQSFKVDLGGRAIKSENFETLHDMMTFVSRTSKLAVSQYTNDDWQAITKQD